MMERADSSPNLFNRMAGILLILALSLANSGLFYFVIWDMLSPSKPYSVILFFVSGGAHLIYFFLPWFCYEMVGSIFGGGSSEATRFDGSSSTGGSGGFFVTICTQFGVVLCVSAIGLWLLQADFLREEKPSVALITKVNCLQIGGEPRMVDGQLLCVVEEKDIGGLTVPAADRRESRI